MVATSFDGKQWDLANVGTNALLIACAYGNGRFVVAGGSRGPFHSYDGHRWFKAATNVNFNDLGFGNGTFIGVDGSTATVWRSTDGSNWSSQAVGFLNHYDRMSYANGQYFILGGDSSFQNFLLYSSTNGTNWSGSVPLGTNGLDKIVFGKGVYVGIQAVLTPNYFLSRIRTSTNGTNWSEPVVLPDYDVADIIFANGQFVAIDVVGRVLLSSDGVNWDEHVTPELIVPTEIAWHAGVYVVSGILGTIYTSTDAVTWTRRTVGPQDSLVSVIRNQELFVAVGGRLVPDGSDFYSQSTVVTSSDGRDWSGHDPGTSNSLTAVTFSAGRYVAVGAAGAIVTSVDGSNWLSVTSPVTNTLNSIAYGSGRFVAVGGGTNRASIITSADGLSWTEQADATNFNTLFGITYALGQFVAVGLTNAAKMATILSSADGLSWTARGSTVTNHLRAINFGNGFYVAVGDRSSIATSSDGVTWTTVVQGGARFLRSIAHANGWHVAVGYPPAIYTSADGVSWVLRAPFSRVSTKSIYGVVYGVNSFLVVGASGQVLECAPFDAAEPAIRLGLQQTDRPFLSLTAPELHGYEIESSDALPSSWQSFAVLTNYSATTTLPMNTSTNPPKRFYRARLLD